MVFTATNPTKGTRHMERIRIDRRGHRLRVRRLAEHSAATNAPLVHATGGDTGIDEDLLARIDAVLRVAGAAVAKPLTQLPED
jgi:hypothetical protein